MKRETKILVPATLIPSASEKEIKYEYIKDDDESVTIVHPSLRLLRQEADLKKIAEEAFDEVFDELDEDDTDLTLLGDNGTSLRCLGNSLKLKSSESDTVEYFLPLILAGAQMAPQIAAMAPGIAGMVGNLMGKKGKGKRKGMLKKGLQAGLTAMGAAKPEEEGKPEEEKETEEAQPENQAMETAQSIANLASMFTQKDMMKKAYDWVQTLDKNYGAELLDTFERAAKGKKCVGK